MEKYKQLVEDLDIEPAIEEIVGLFLDLVKKNHGAITTSKSKNKKKPKMKEQTASRVLRRNIRLKNLTTK